MSIEQITAATNYLVSHPRYEALKEAILGLVRTPDPDTVGQFEGEQRILNALVDYGRAYGAHRLQALWTLIEARRPTPELPPRVGERKRRYQASYMSERRKRLRKAAQLYERHNGIVLDKAGRQDFQTAQQALWVAGRDELLDRTPGLSHDERLDLARTYWDDIDARLDAELAGRLGSARSALGEQDG